MGKGGMGGMEGVGQRHHIFSLISHKAKDFGLHPEGNGEPVQSFKYRNDTIRLSTWGFERFTVEAMWKMNWRGSWENSVEGAVAMTKARDDGKRKTQPYSYITACWARQILRTFDQPALGWEGRRQGLQDN